VVNKYNNFTITSGIDCLQDGHTKVNISPVFYLLAVSIIWSASFGLYKVFLTNLDPNLMAFLRLSLALLVFLPFLRPGKIPARARLVFCSIGMLQYGLMYLMFNEAYQYLDGWQVALMTLFTPIYIVAISSIRKHHLDYLFLLAAALSVVGASVAMFKKGCVPPDSLHGCLLVQASDICFALGQLLYRDARKKYTQAKDHELYALLFAGATLIALGGTLATGGIRQLGSITTTQWWLVLYMGIVASGLGFFWWNLGATKVRTGILAVMSNIKVPMAVTVSLLVFGECSGSWPRLLAGASIMVLAVYLAQKRAKCIA
jgi:drug/metabolite transporter (DMT)-like permease